MANDMLETSVYVIRLDLPQPSSPQTQMRTLLASVQCLLDDSRAMDLPVVIFWGDGADTCLEGNERREMAMN